MELNSVSSLDVEGYPRCQSSVIDQALEVQLSLRDLDDFELRGEPLAAIARIPSVVQLISMLHGRTEEVYA